MVKAKSLRNGLAAACLCILSACAAPKMSKQEAAPAKEPPPPPATARLELQQLKERTAGVRVTSEAERRAELEEQGAVVSGEVTVEGTPGADFDVAPAKPEPESEPAAAEPAEDDLSSKTTIPKPVEKKPESLHPAVPPRSQAAPKRRANAPRSTKKAPSRTTAVDEVVKLSSKRESSTRVESRQRKKSKKGKKRDFGFTTEDKDLGDFRDELSQKKRRPRQLLPKKSRTGFGKLLIKGPDGKDQALHPKEVRVLAYVQGTRARTIVDYVFENPFSQDLEGQFHYPLPTDAQAAGLSVFAINQKIVPDRFFTSGKVLPQLKKGLIDPLDWDEQITGGKKGGLAWQKPQHAQVVGALRGRRIYSQSIEEKEAPSLLEWVGGNDFSLKIYPIQGKRLKRIVFAYEQDLSVYDGAVRYRYQMPDSSQVLKRSLVAFIDQSLGGPIDVSSFKPAVFKKARKGRWMRYENYRLPRGAEVMVDQKQQETIVLRGPTQVLSGDSFLVNWSPKLPRVVQQDTKRALLVVDTSLSGELGGAFARKGELLSKLLESDESIAEYAILCFDVRARFLTGARWVQNSPENRKRSLEQLKRIVLEGATNFASVGQTITQNQTWLFAQDQPTAFLFSDGKLTWGNTSPRRLLARYPVLGQIRWVNYRTDEAGQHHALSEALVRSHGGVDVQVMHWNDLDAAMLAHREAPILVESISVVGTPARDLFIAGTPRQIYPGQRLNIVGRLPQGGEGELVLRLRSAGETSIRRLPLRSKTNADRFAARAWAHHAAQTLIREDDPRLDPVILALSQSFYLANARASLILSPKPIAAPSRTRNQELIEDVSKARELALNSYRGQQRGLSLEKLTPKNRQTVQLIKRKSDGLVPLLAAFPLVSAPKEGGVGRAQAERAYLSQPRIELADSLENFEAIARIRALAGDSLGAVRALSSGVELRPHDPESLRLVGYVLLALGQYQPACELFGRLRRLRSFEGQSYLEEALALDAAGKYDQAARNYEIVLARSWFRHQDQIYQTAKLHYARLLLSFVERASLSYEESQTILARAGQLRGQNNGLGGDFDYNLTLHWNADQVDIDLWVYDPAGAKCFHKNPRTPGGAELAWDVSDGLGPERFFARRAQNGSYDLMVHYYGRSLPKVRAPTALLLVVDRGLYRAGHHQQREFLVRLLPRQDALMLVRSEQFGSGRS